MAGRLESQLQDLLDEPVDEPEAVSGKVGQDEADYIEEGPLPFVCDNCDYSQGESCEVVDGQIVPLGACRYFCAAPKTREKATAHMMVEGRMGGFERRG